MSKYEELMARYGLPADIFGVENSVQDTPASTSMVPPQSSAQAEQLAFPWTPIEPYVSDTLGPDEEMLAGHEAQSADLPIAEVDELPF